MPRATKVNLRKAVAGGLVLSAIAAGIFLWPQIRHSTDTYLASRPVGCEPMKRSELIEKQPIKNIVSPNVGGMGMFEYKPPFPGAGTAHPHVAIMAFDGWLLGADKGEFGGGIIYEKVDASQIFLANENVEDIFQMPFGFVATTGYWHMMDDGGMGSLMLVTMQRGTPVAKKIFDLPAAAASSWLLANGDLLVNTSKGSFVLGADMSLKPIKCRPTKEVDA